MKPTATRWPTPSVVRGTAVILPGSGYSAEMPLLYCAARTLVAVGFDVVSISWPVERDWAQDGVGLVRAGLAAAVEAAGATPDLVVAKSIGALSAEVLPEVPHVLLTPVLAPGYPASLGNATAGERGGVAIGGSRDPLWSAEAARARGFDVVEIADAAHTLEVEGAWRESLEALGRVLEAIELFATRVAAGSAD
ncbi:hypothetical protein [Microterricola viridarii]|uniref:Alpha/beta hydrolase n=1 Tax=Microterricola viridarii TaxID=412690 RepID=A0A1H1S8Z5_9MICO|nr:hypothetical protein [Microterricola viridarii]SDS44422.1 hypothetical protein SAMN04489834_1493 [Microterricola viridarii]